MDGVSGGDREPDAASLARLAALPPIEYDRVREAEAKALNCRVGTLDAEVAAARGSNGNGGDVHGAAVDFAQPAPWPDPVDGVELLAAIAAEVRRFLVLSVAAADAVALWVLHTHAHEAAEHSPILAVTSPEKRCGKTTLLSVLAPLVPKPLPTANVTAAAIFRSVEKWRPTLLIDEADTFLRDNEDLRGILNSGHSRASASILRTVGEDHEPRRFATWAPKVIAAIGTLPGTLADRAIDVRLQRRTQAEQVERFRDRVARPALEVLCRQAARWVADHTAALADADPEVPEALHDRACDNWRAMVAIADAVGGEWPERARKAAISLSAGAADEGSIGADLLADIRAIFEERGCDALASEELAAALAQRDGRPWPEWKGKPITANGVARLLKRFAVHPKNIRIGGRVPKGYERAMFDDVFSRYIPPIQTATTATSLKSQSNSGFQTATKGPNVAVANGEILNEINRVAVVAVQNPQTQGEGDEQTATPSWSPLRAKVSL